MFKNTIVGMTVIFFLTVVVMGSVAFAQTVPSTTPADSTGAMTTTATPTPTLTQMQVGVGGGPGMPSSAPAAGFGGMAHH